jgi:hypothetical protein
MRIEIGAGCQCNGSLFTAHDLYLYSDNVTIFQMLIFTAGPAVSYEVYEGEKPNVQFQVMTLLFLVLIRISCNKLWKY